MANFANLKAAINAAIKTNGAQEITGAVLNTILNSCVTELGKGYVFGGIVSPSDSFDSTTYGDVNVFFLGYTPGTYTNYGGATVTAGHIALFLYNGSWTTQEIFGNYWTYGIRHYFTNSSPDVTRIGNADLHRDLPIQSQMRRCVVNDDGEVVYYLDADDSTKKLDGTAAKLDGTDGQVMVEIPAHYRRCTMNATDSYMDVEISQYPFEGAVAIPRYLVSAYEAALDRTNSKLCSVVNTDAQFRGGNNNADWDETYRSLLGLPATNISLTNFRAYAKARGSHWGCYDYNAHLALYWIFVIEYATLNSQKAFDSTLTSEGYHKGGLGDGVSNFSNWSTYNSYNPIIPCGFTNSLGNKTGVKTFTLDAEQAEAYGGAHSESVPSYRGVENPFGHIYKWTDGYLGVGNGTYQEVYICRDASKYASSVTSDYVDIGHEATANGYCKAIIASDSDLAQDKRVYGDIFDRDDSGSSSTYFCDYHSHASADGTTYGLLVGGNAYDGAYDGLAFVNAIYGPAYANAYIGSRLCWS